MLSVLALVGLVLCQGVVGKFDLVAEYVTLPFKWDVASGNSESFWREQGYPNTSALAGIKQGYDGSIYVTVPRWRSGVPSTLNKLIFDGDDDLQPILEPFPSWEFNNNTLRNAQSMLIDTHNRMWIIDVGRENFADPTSSTLINAPAKVFVLNLDTYELDSSLSYTFPDHVVPWNNSFLNDIALDLDGGRAYFTSTQGDGLLVVYDFVGNTSWSFTGPSTERDPSYDFIVNGYNYGNCDTCIGASSPVDGIALSDDMSTLFYCPVGGTQLWTIDTAVLGNNLTTAFEFNSAAVPLVNKTGPSDGLWMTQGTLYYGDLSHSSLTSLDVSNMTDLTTSSSVLLGQSDDNYRWIDTFSGVLDATDDATLYFTSNKLDLFFNNTMPMSATTEPNFRIYRYSASATGDDDDNDNEDEEDKESDDYITIIACVTLLAGSAGSLVVYRYRKLLCPASWFIDVHSGIREDLMGDQPMSSSSPL